MWQAGAVTGRVLGADACRAGWVGIVLDGDAVTAHFGATIAALVAAAEQAGPIEVVGIDIPIGLADHGPRAADLQAYAKAGIRRSSVFITPVRRAVEAADYAAAAAVQRDLGLKGISQQAFHLRAKILDVDGWLRDGQTRRVVEVHPELSFAAMAGAPLAFRKSCWAGAEQRRALLAAEGALPAGDLGTAGAAAGVDDVLDAAAAAWTARRVLTGRAGSLPPEPEFFADGIPCAIWT
ncbi:hypothetical protein Cba03nite_43640 [Catellatospora bangladeshensis]|uniref:DUF429 domain-containing protein n=1 Tax=Catellatospora bangladeshensis TaxID=310355 RepID=A0A8J3NLW7_9ACTN|nr:hypothetical protein Cba03nite_43640 [Catellatospora bangladeshensis]